MKKLPPRKSQYLTVNYAGEDTGSTDTSIYHPSRSQTPLLQQLYLTMTHWERVVASNANQFKKNTHLTKLRKSKQHHIDFSDASSVDFSPKKTPHESLKFLKKRKSSLLKSSSLRSVNKSSSSPSSSPSDDDNYETIMSPRDPNAMATFRPVSAPPVILQQKSIYN